MTTWLRPKGGTWRPGHMGTSEPEHLETLEPGKLSVYLRPQDLGLNTWAPQDLGTWTPGHLRTWEPEYLGTSEPRNLDSRSPGCVNWPEKPPLSPYLTSSSTTDLLERLIAQCAYFSTPPPHCHQYVSFLSPSSEQWTYNKSLSKTHPLRSMNLILRVQEKRIPKLLTRSSLSDHQVSRILPPLKGFAMFKDTQCSNISRKKSSLGIWFFFQWPVNSQVHTCSDLSQIHECHVFSPQHMSTTLVAYKIF